MVKYCNHNGDNSQTFQILMFPWISHHIVTHLQSSYKINNVTKYYYQPCDTWHCWSCLIIDLGHGVTDTRLSDHEKGLCLFNVSTIQWYCCCSQLYLLIWFNSLKRDSLLKLVFDFSLLIFKDLKVFGMNVSSPHLSYQCLSWLRAAQIKYDDTQKYFC